MDAFHDIDHLEPFLRSFVIDLTDIGPLVPDPGGLAVFGIGLILLGFLRRTIFG